MKNRRRHRMCKMASESVLMDGDGEEYHIVEKRLPRRRKSVYDTYVVRQKTTERDCLVEIHVAVANPAVYQPAAGGRLVIFGVGVKRY